MMNLLSVAVRCNISCCMSDKKQPSCVKNTVKQTFHYLSIHAKFRSKAGLPGHLDANSCRFVKLVGGELNPILEEWEVP